MNNNKRLLLAYCAVGVFLTAIIVAGYITQRAIIEASSRANREILQNNYQIANRAFSLWARDRMEDMRRSMKVRAGSVR